MAASLCGGVALLGALVAVERRASQPMLPPALFRARAFSAGCAARFLLSCSLFAAVAAAFSLAGAATALWLPRRRDVAGESRAMVENASRTDIHAVPAS